MWLLLTLPAVAATPERIPLTLELLQDRLEHPISQEGKNTIDLHQLTIDLSEENRELRDRFYGGVQDELNRAKTPLSIDLSQSVIFGNFQIQPLGLKTQLVKEVLSGLLSPEQQQQLQEKLQLEQSSNWGEHFQNLPYISLFRGALKLRETRFQGSVNLSNTLFLDRVDAKGAIFVQEGDISDSYFLDPADFTGVTFQGDFTFARSHFLQLARFDRAHFQNRANFTGARFVEDAAFTQAEFNGLANWTGSSWQGTADFTQGIWRDRALFANSVFLKSLNFARATFEKAVAFRGSFLNASLNLQEVSLLEQMDFSNALFARDASVEVGSLALDSQAAKIFGSTGALGRRIRVAQLQGNEQVLQNLVHNFRRLEQIPDANAVEYLRSRLRVQQLRRRLSGISFLRWGGDVLLWLGLNLLLLLSNYGTNFSLVLMVGLLSSAFFALLFWCMDRVRRRYPQPILPTPREALWMLGSFAIVSGFCLGIVFQVAPQPWLTLTCLSAILLPFPLLVLGLLYRQGRHHDLIEESYLLEDGELRRLRLLIARLPTIPRYYFFRDRYLPLLCDRRWSWLNYYDFSLNNLLKFGFNDIRLRDRHLPGFFSALVWYEWSLGILYIVLLFWTLSRTIPGLNLLIYLK